MPAEARIIPSTANTTVVLKPPLTRSGDGRRRTDRQPVAARRDADAERAQLYDGDALGAVDPRWQHELLHKPAQSLTMTFSADPHLGMVADRFSGNAVVFLATSTFAPQTTASLR